MSLEYYLLPTDRSDAIFEEALALDWLTETNSRREYFMSLIDREYTYGNRSTGDRTYKSSPMTPLIQDLMEELEEYNVCFLNRYDSEKQHLGWHADDSPLMVPDSSIAVASFGAERYIYHKEKTYKGPIPDSGKQLLEHGSVWIMPEGYQNTHVHKIPKHSEPCGTRISLTFRNFT